MILLKSHFSHWLNAVSRDNILKKSMFGRSTAFGYGGLDILFYSNGSKFVRIYV